MGGEGLGRNHYARIFCTNLSGLTFCLPDPDQDVNDRALIDALSYVRSNVEKGPMLVEGFQKALLEPHPNLRQENVKRYVDMIFTWAGY